MTDTELAYAKTWRIQKWMTSMRKAIEGCLTHPTGLSRLTLEGLDRDMKRARAELDRRKPVKAA